MQSSKQSGKLRTFPDLENPENNQNGQSSEAFYFTEILTLDELKIKKTTDYYNISGSSLLETKRDGPKEI